MANTVRLTVAQALVKFLNNQYIEFDGKQNKMFKGIFTILVMVMLLVLVKL